PALEFRFDEAVQQFLFNDSERLLLISTSSTDLICNLRAKKEVCRQRWGTRQSRRWIEHPEKPELLVWVDPVEVRTYNWTELEHHGTIEMTESARITPANPSERS